jgi:hypothetical protein
VAADMGQFNAIRFLRAIPGSGRQNFGGTEHTITQNKK